LLAAAAKQAPIKKSRSASDTPDQSLAAVEAEDRAASTLIVVSSRRAAYRVTFAFTMPPQPGQQRTGASERR